MIVGVEKLHECTAALAAGLESDELVEVDEVLVIVAVHYGADADEPDAEVGSLFYRCTSARPHVQVGLLHRALAAVEVSGRKRPT